MKDGDEIVFEREAEQIPDMIPGDVIFTVKQHPHKTFKRVGDNLYVDLSISLEEALLGFSKRISHLDGHLVEIRSAENEVQQPFAWKVIKSEGMPKRNVYSEFGDLHAKMNIQFPKTLTEK
jgi:DnaJ-related protein SCJ1